jgi:endonuclease/exonuclease/phosphatase family metal-dependent hydrolase
VSDISPLPRKEFAPTFPATSGEPFSDDELSGFKTLSLLSYNIQVGINISHYRQYLTHSWKHVLPHNQRLRNLDLIAQIINDFDIVALQEVDSGSFRSNFINQIEYLAVRGHFPFWYNQINRNLGRFAQHSNGMLSRYRAHHIVDHKLPGILPGRGVMEARFGPSTDPLVLLLVHLGLGRRARMRQLKYISDIVNANEHVIIMGDFNCTAQSAEIDSLLGNTHLCEPVDNLHTYPSWQPIHNIDHIMVTPDIRVNHLEVLETSLSDHLPIMVEVTVPDKLASYWKDRYQNT